MEKTYRFEEIYTSLDLTESSNWEDFTVAYQRESNRKLPFKCTIFDEAPQEVKNPFSGDSCMLDPDAIAVYDMITGGNLTGNYEIVRQGCDWFREHFPKEYMILLD